MLIVGPTIPQHERGWQSRSGFPGIAGILPAWTIAGLRQVVHFRPPAGAGKMPALPGRTSGAYFHSKP